MSAETTQVPSSEVRTFDFSYVEGQGLIPYQSKETIDPSVAESSESTEPSIDAQAIESISSPPPTQENVVFHVTTTFARAKTWLLKDNVPRYRYIPQAR